MDTCKKKTLKEIALIFRDKSAELQYQTKFDQWYDYVLDIIDTKLFKPSFRSKNQTKKNPQNICTVEFCNKGIELINLNKIFKSKQAVDCLPVKLKEPDFIPTVAYKLLAFFLTTRIQLSLSKSTTKFLFLLLALVSVNIPNFVITIMVT